MIPWHNVDLQLKLNATNKLRVANPGVRVSGRDVLVNGQLRRVKSVSTMLMDCKETYNTFIVTLGRSRS